jgi:glycosyltransferase involved in cell wall biosynthesis
MNSKVDHVGGHQGGKDDPRSPHHVLVLTYWNFNDALIQSYTLPYVRIMLDQLPPGSVVHLVTLEKEGRPQIRCEEPGIVLHPFRYRPFGWRALGMMMDLVWRCCLLVWQYRIGTVHAWCTPAGMIGHIVSVITRRPLVLDSYEPHAEAMVENGSWSRSGAAFKTLFLFERWQSQRAVAHIACASGMHNYARETYGVRCKRFFVKPACVDLERSSLKLRKDPALMRELGLEGKLVAVYAGKFGGIYLEQEVFDLFRVARDHWGERFRVLLLTAHSMTDLGPFMRAAGLDPSMFTVRFVPHSDVLGYMGLADFALTPVRSVPTKRYCTPIKDGEYWALGLPVIITPNISDDSRIISEAKAGAVLDGLDDASYRNAVLEMDELLKEGMEALYLRIRPLAEKHRNFARAVAVYRDIYGNVQG